MASPFPGMDPYLEDQDIWRGFHHHLAEDIVSVLNAELSTRYFADVEVHTTIEEIEGAHTHVYPDAIVVEVDPDIRTPSAVAVAIPDAPIQRTAALTAPTKLRAVQVYETDSRQLVTTIEILSPANKRGQGLTKYRRKRHNILLSDVHLIEIDLLRGGQRPGWEVNEPPLDTDYVLLVNRAGERRVSEIWPVGLSEPLPTLPVPLLLPDPDIPLDMAFILKNIYTRAVYARRINYTEPVPPPKLRPEVQAWLAQQMPNIG